MPIRTKASPLLAALSATAVIWGSNCAALAQDRATQERDAAQTDAISRAPVAAAAPGGPEQGAEPSGRLVLLFETGSATLDPRNQAILDEASRLYREGRPIIMTVTGGTDAVGAPEQNLLLSQRRANAVARGLLARGLPAERTQIVAKGETNPAVPASRGVPEAQNRRVEITWRQ